MEARIVSNSISDMIRFSAETVVPAIKNVGNEVMEYSVLILTRLKNGSNRFYDHLHEDGIIRSIKPRMPMLRNIVVQV